MFRHHKPLRANCLFCPCGRARDLKEDQAEKMLPEKLFGMQTQLGKMFQMWAQHALCGPNIPTHDSCVGRRLWVLGWSGSGSLLVALAFFE